MADLKKTVEILFQGDDQASSKAAQVIDKVRSLEDTSTPSRRWPPLWSSMHSSTPMSRLNDSSAACAR